MSTCWKQCFKKHLNSVTERNKVIKVDKNNLYPPLKARGETSEVLWPCYQQYKFRESAAASSREDSVFVKNAAGRLCCLESSQTQRLSRGLLNGRHLHFKWLATFVQNSKPEHEVRTWCKIMSELQTSVKKNVMVFLCNAASSPYVSVSLGKRRWSLRLIEESVLINQWTPCSLG